MLPIVDAVISVDRIEEAAGLIDPVFLHSPQFDCAPLSDRLGVETILKVETVNPIRSFKGRGADYLLHRLTADKDQRRIVCASAGNFGQGMAYACRSRGRKITVFAARNANSLKVERMRTLGAHIELTGDDFDEAKDAAREHARKNGDLYIEDGRIGAIAEGAGTIARELTEAKEPLDAVFVPLGNGSLVNGIGTWLKRHSPQTKIIAVCAQDSPSMAISFEKGEPAVAPSTSIADGIAVRVPIQEAVAAMQHTVDEVMLVPDDEMLAWMRHLHTDAGLVIEPAGAAGIAAIAQSRGHHKFARVGAILTGGNLTQKQMEEWL
ncbi:MAG: pyridoxal-phosphate dependent enzyme [Chloroflexi bacterium]|nr:MAG: pyridoxal-phosphate dependent enzyme [Chloroflexota bacterium]